MRAVFITLSLILATVTMCDAQTYVYASEREYCAYNPATEEFDKCESWEDHSLFVINDRETSFQHFTDDVNSLYQIDSKEYNEDMEMNLWYVTSNAGNKYTYVVNLENKAIAALYDNGDESFIVTFTISKYWK
jgi:hypothetical protein